MVLIVCKGIVELHGGTISVSSDGIGTGCTFHIDLPMSNTGKELLVRAPSVVSHSNNSNDNRHPEQCLSSHSSNHLINEYLVTAISRNHHVGKIQPYENQHEIKILTACDGSSIKADSHHQDDVCINRHLGAGLFGLRHMVDRDQKELNDFPTVRAHNRIRNEAMEVEEIKRNEKIPNTFERCTPKHLKRILIVDDVPMNRKMLRRVLENRYDIIDEAENGQEAVDMVKATVGGEIGSYYDMITMDYQMPVLDGITATRRIRDVGYVGHIIAVTGNALREDTERFLSSGANKVLTKPLSLAALDSLF